MQFSLESQRRLFNNDTLVEGSIPITRRGDMISGDYWLEIAKGHITDHSIVFVSGKNRNVPTNTNHSIWSYGGLYPWSAWNGGQLLYVASSNSLDTNIVVLINGLDTSYNQITEIVSTNASNGTTAVVTTRQFYRINSIINIGSKACVGNITFRVGSAAGAVVGYIDALDQMHRASIYTVPAGYTAYSVYGDFAVSSADHAQLNAHWRFFGGVFVQVYSTETTGAYKADPRGPGAIPEKTDIDNRVNYGTNNLRCISNQQLILVKNENS